MSDSDEVIEDRDDFVCDITNATDEESNSNGINADGNDLYTDGEAGMEPEPGMERQQHSTGGCCDNVNNTDAEVHGDLFRNEANVIPQILAKEFATEEEADMCYREYARTVGFGIRKHNKRRNVKGNITGRTWVCSREGFRLVKHVENRNRIREARAVTRTGCRAQFRIIFNEQTGQWACSYFYGVHNHKLTPPQLVHHIRSHRKVTGPDLLAASSLQQVGVKPSQIHEFMVHKSGGYDKVGYSRRDVQNSLDWKRRKELKESDAVTCLSYLEGKKSSDPSFFYDFTVTSCNRLGDLFWCDGGCCADYALFGDVIAFDATYKTNAYRKPFVVILGINHHRRTIVFGFALLSDETEHTYTWLLETFMSAMNNKQPKTVITDGDRAMRNAISKTFPRACHRLCCWHLARNAQANVNNTEFTKQFRRCMLNAYTEDEFNRKWKLMVAKHQVATNEWVVKMFEEKHMWAEAYLRGHFFGGMRSTQRSEGMNAYLNHYVNRRLRLIEFVKQMDRLMDRQREGEGKDDFDSCDGRPILVTHLKLYEQQVADKYTRAVFRLVRQQIDKEGMLTAVMTDRDITSTTYQVRQFGVSGRDFKVVVNDGANTLSCSCMLVQTCGIPCAHLFVVMKAENMREIPSSMILRRWTKGAKVTDGSSSETNFNNAYYMTEQARVGLIYASCRSLLRYAGSSVAAYNVAISDIHKLTLRLEAMCQQEAPGREALHAAHNFIQDPEIVLTKGSVKHPKTGQRQKRKCSRCGAVGHNVRKCKQKGATGEPVQDSSSHCADLFSDSNVCSVNRLHATYTSFVMHEPTNCSHVLPPQQSTGNRQTVGLNSDSGFQQFTMTTDTESTNPTLNTTTFPYVSDYITTSSSTPTNYGDISTPHRRQ